MVVVHSGGQRTIWGERYDPPAISDVWRARLGTYRAEIPTDCMAYNLPPEKNSYQKNYYLVERDGAIVLQQDESILVMNPAGDNLAFVAGIGRGHQDSAVCSGNTIECQGIVYRKQP